MLRILIVDDEPITADGIYDVLTEIEGFETEIYTVYSGKDALEFMGKYRVDLLVSDICMADVDGLTLQKQVIKLWPFCKVIFLTGHEEFDYIHEAIRNNSLDYILKSEDDDQIKQSVIKALKLIEEERRNQLKLDQAESYVKEFTYLLCREYMLEMIQGFSVGRQEIKAAFDKLNIPLDVEKPLLLLLGRIEEADNAGASALNMKTNLKLQHLISQHLYPAVNCISTSVSREEPVWFIQPGELNREFDNAGDAGIWKRTVSYIFEMLDVIQQQIREQFGLTMSFIIHESELDWEEISSVYDRIHEILNVKYRFAKQIVLVNNVAVRGDRDNADACLEDSQLVLNVEKKAQMLEIYLNSVQRKKYDQLVEEIMDLMFCEKQAGADVKVKLFFLLASTFLKIIYRYNLTAEVESRINMEKLLNITRHADDRELKAYFLELSRVIFDCKNNSNDQQNEIIISSVQSYIEKNLKQQLSLTELAEMYHFNSSYFSRLFKTVTGRGLSDYIIDRRIELAKALLEKNMKVHEIAEETGFHSVSYFINVFKKKVGLTPKQYIEQSKNN